MNGKEYGVLFPDEPVIGGYSSHAEADAAAQELRMSDEETYMVVAREATPWEEVQDAPAVP